MGVLSSEVADQGPAEVEAEADVQREYRLLECQGNLTGGVESCGADADDVLPEEGKIK